MHGFSACWFGRRTRSLGSGGSRVGAGRVEAPFRGIFGDWKLCFVNPRTGGGGSGWDGEHATRASPWAGIGTTAGGGGRWHVVRCGEVRLGQVRCLLLPSAVLIRVRSLSFETSLIRPHKMDSYGKQNSRLAAFGGSGVRGCCRHASSRKGSRAGGKE